MTWCDIRVEFIPTPGHTPGSICIAFENALFTGDTLIHNLKTITKLPGGNRRDLEQSINHLLDRFGSSTVVYPGHNEPFRFGQINRDVILGRMNT